ncbi:hypothetical protein F2Q68_00043127 [Brassica cretica]|uniref:Uncharacterized protein n=1 Tax=Brassica cretica TaxID=69181 RepID=A0A8S9LKS3_BRACR|nr:hypothetical protein F2Q68_00043127 [Brassica cretica]
MKKNNKWKLISKSVMVIQKDKDQIEEEEEQHVKSGTEVVDSGKASETSKNDEDEEVNEDASKDSEKVKEKKKGPAYFIVWLRYLTRIVLNILFF